MNKLKEKTESRSGNSFAFFGAFIVLTIIFLQGFPLMINTGIIDNGAALAEEKKDNTAFIDYVLAEVNGKPVTTSALIKGYSAFLVMSGQPDANLKGLTIDSFLDRCIRETVLLQAAEKAAM